MGELVADAAQQQLGDAAPASPADHDQIRILAVRDVCDDKGPVSRRIAGRTALPDQVSALHAELEWARIGAA